MPHCAFGMIWHRCYSSTRQTYQYDICKNNKKMLLVLRNRTYIYAQFDAQKAGNGVSELPDFKFFWGGGMSLDPPSKRGLAAPCQYRHLLFSNWLPTLNFIETPALLLHLSGFIA